MDGAFEPVEVTLIEAAQRLGWRYGRARDAILAKQLDGRLADGRWVVTTASLRKLMAKERRSAAVSA
jgi:hypothetical protein